MSDNEIVKYGVFGSLLVVYATGIMYMVYHLWKEHPALSLLFLAMLALTFFFAYAGEWFD